MHLLPFIVGQEFQALFMSTTEPVDAEGNTTNPTKSPCDPYIFNSVLTRSKSLVVVVGSPWALLGIEEHMEKLYGKKAHCWSSYIRLCLENDTFIIPPEVEPSEVKRLKFNLQLKAKLFDTDTSRIARQVADSLHCELPVPPVHEIPDHSRWLTITSSMRSSFHKTRVSSLESNLYLFDAPLTPENYQERFHHLLCWEEHEHIKQLAERLVLC